jgi:hypothetical protein
VDFCTCDGASNIQSLGDVLSAHYPRILCTHSAENIILLFLRDWFSSPVLNCFVKISKKTYALFVSGAMHMPYAFVHKHSPLFNNGQNVAFLQQSQTQMGGEATSLQRLLGLKEPLQESLELNDFMKL